MNKIIHTFTAMEALPFDSQAHLEHTIKMAKLFNPNVRVRVTYKTEDDMQQLDTIEIDTLYLLDRDSTKDPNETLIYELFHSFGCTLARYFSVKLELVPSK